MIPFCCVGGHYAPTRASERVLLQCCAMSRQLGRLRAWLPTKSLIWQPAKMPMGGDIVGTRKRHLGWALKDLRRSSRPQLLSLLDGVPAVFCLTTHIKIVFTSEHLAERLAYEGVVVHDQYRLGHFPGLPGLRSDF